MKLIIEDPIELDGSIEEEINESSGKTERNYYLEGVFSTPEKKNRNGRVYSRAIWEREVARYQDEIRNKTINTLGEWQHPPRSTVDPMKAVMRIVELKFKPDGQVWGKCKILNNNTDETNKLKGLIKEGIKIGVSTRGVGKVSSSGIVEEYKMITADLVDIPSNHASELTGVVEGHKFENGVMLDKEYGIDENGCIGEACKIQKKNPIYKNEQCEISKLIDEKINEAKEDIYTKINDYLVEAFENERNELSENLSGYLKKVMEDEIIENISNYLSERDSIYKKDISTKLIEAFNKIAEKR